MDIEIIKPFEETFSLDDAFELMHCTVVSKDKSKPTIENTGVVQGVLDTDLEVELIIRFLDGLRKYNKTSFLKEFEVYIQDA